MAKLTEQQKEEVLYDFHTGEYSQRQLAKKHSMSLGTINKITKDIEPKNEHLVNAQVAVLKGKSEISDGEMNAVMNAANDKARRMNLVFGGLEKLAKKTTDYLDKNKAQKVVSGKFGADIITHELQSNDYKNIADTFEKVGKAFGIIQDKPDVAIQNNNVQNKTIEIVVE